MVSFHLDCNCFAAVLVFPFLGAFLGLHVLQLEVALFAVCSAIFGFVSKVYLRTVCFVGFVLSYFALPGFGLYGLGFCVLCFACHFPKVM